MPADPIPLLIHLHIPRNAGSTLGRVLRLKLGFWPPSHLLHHFRTLGFYRLAGFQQRLDVIEALSASDRRRVRLFEAHAGFGLHERLPQPSTYLTMLREPIDRAVSVFYYQRQHDRIPDDMTLEQFVLNADPQRVWWVDNAQVRYLAGTGGKIVDVARGQCTRTMLDVAIERLEEVFAFVGIVEQFDESLVLLRRMFDWRGCYYVASNATKRRRRTEELQSAELALLNEHNELDCELYRYAKSLFQRRVEEAGSSFQRELAQFALRNNRHARWIGPTQWILSVGWQSIMKLVLGRTGRRKPQ
jgi:hypothetical protein